MRRANAGQTADHQLPHKIPEGARTTVPQLEETIRQFSHQRTASGLRGGWEQDAGGGQAAYNASMQRDSGSLHEIRPWSGPLRLLLLEEGLEDARLCRSELAAACPQLFLRPGLLQASK